jgi:hypothetical protein
VLTHDTALRTAELPTSDLLDTGALSFELAVADSFRLDGPDGPVLRARRTSNPAAWRAVTPPGLKARIAQADIDLLAKDLVVDLDRLPALAAIPPVAGSRLPRETVYRLVAWGDEPGLSGRRELLFGPAADVIERSRTASLAAETSAVLVAVPDGRALLVPADVLVWFRSLSETYSR